MSGCNFVLNHRFTIDGSERTMRSAKERVQFLNRPDLQEVVMKESSNFSHTNRCVPNHQQCKIGARRADTLLDKENELDNHLLTIMELALQHFNNNCLTELSLINPSQLQLKAEQLRNFHLWAKTASIIRLLPEKMVLKTNKDLNVMFADIAPLHPMSSVAVEQAKELYHTLLRDILENDGNFLKVQQYLKTLHESDPSFDFQMVRNGENEENGENGENEENGENGENGAATAIMWQTGTVRVVFKIHVCALHIKT